MLLLSASDFFSKLTFSNHSFRNTIIVSKGLDPDQDRHSVGPDLGPNCLQRLSLLLPSGDFYQIKLLQNILSGTLSECQTVWIQIRTDFLSKLFAKVISRLQMLLLSSTDLFQN